MKGEKKEEEKNKNEKENCPLCQVSEETLKILREKGKKEKAKNNEN